MRVLLFTGKGGAGKTTCAAATGTLAASRRRKTLVVSTDTAHSLADAFGATAGPDPTEIAPALFVQQVDAQRAFERSWREIQHYLLSVLEAAGIDPFEAEELTVLPGAEEVLALLEVRDQVRSGRFDLVIVDCAPTAETLRLLALPEALGWYVDRILPIERKVVRSLRPMLDRVAGVPMPGGSVFDALERLHAELREVRAVLTDPGTSVRLVLTPESVVVAEARRTLTSLSLYGYRVDAVVANRIFPTAGADAWRARWVESQAAQLDDVEESFSPLPIYRSPYRPTEPVGIAELAAFADETYGDADPFGLRSLPEPLQVERVDGEYVLTLALPFTDRDEMDLARKGDELVITARGCRRVLALPSALRQREITAAMLREGRLRVRFQGDAEQGRAP